MRKIKRISLICIVLYTLLLSYWMLFGFGRRTYPEYMYNLKPLHTIIQFMQIDRYNRNIWVVNLLGNIGVFVPFGILLPFALRGKLIKSFSVFLVSLIILELLQLITRRGCFDVDDIILNSLGFLIGYAFCKLLGLFLCKGKGK